MTEQMKRCSKCGELKPLSEFYRRESSKDGYRSECKSCNTAQNKKYYRDHQETEKTRRREYYKKNQPKILAKDKTRYNQRKEVRKKQYKNYAACVNKPSCPAVGQRGAEFVIMSCPVCGTTFRRRQATIDWAYEKKGQTNFYCSRECQWESMRKGYKSPYARRITELLKVHQ